MPSQALVYVTIAEGSLHHDITNIQVWLVPKNLDQKAFEFLEKNYAAEIAKLKHFVITSFTVKERELTQLENTKPFSSLKNIKTPLL